MAVTVQQRSANNPDKKEQPGTQEAQSKRLIALPCSERKRLSF